MSGYGRPVKADPAHQSLLLDVQRADTTMDHIAHRVATLPATQQARQLAADVAELNGLRVEAETKVADLSAEQDRADADVETVRARHARDTERLSSGAITNPKDLASLQHELEALDRRIGVLEDVELEIMEALEEAGEELSAVRESLTAKQSELDAVVAERDAALAEFEEQRAEASAERDRIVADVPDDLQALYEKLRAQYNGLGAAALRARSCEGCRLELNGADLREIAGLGADDVVRCPECSRILVRTEESGL